MDNESKLLSKCFPPHCYNKNKLYYANKAKLSNTELQFGLIYHCTLHIQNVPQCLIIIKKQPYYHMCLILLPTKH